MPTWVIKINNDITGQKAAETSLRPSTAELQAILDGVPAIIWVARDQGGRSVIDSRFAHDFYRIPYGANPFTPLPENEFARVKVIAEGRELTLTDMPVLRAARGEMVRNYEMEVVFDDSSSRRAFGNAIPLLDESGQRRGAVATFVDVAERTLAEAALRDKEAAETATRAKSDFLAVMSHEIRTPIRGCKPNPRLFGSVWIRGLRIGRPETMANLSLHLVPEFRGFGLRTPESSAGSSAGGWCHDQTPPGDDEPRSLMGKSPLRLHNRRARGVAQINGRRPDICEPSTSSPKALPPHCSYKREDR